MAGDTFEAKLTAHDGVSAVLGKIQRELGQLSRSAATAQRNLNTEAKASVWENWGRRVQNSRAAVQHWGATAVEKFKKATEGAREFRRGIVEMMPPLAALSGALSIAGAGALMDKWAHMGGNVQRTAALLGVSTRQLQGLQGAAELAGVSADSMTGALAGLQQHLHGAAWGRDREAIAVLRGFGVAARDSQGNVRDAGTVFEQLADHFAKIKDPEIQKQLADALGLRQALPILQQGGAAVRRFVDAAGRHGAIVPDDELNKARALELAWIGLEQSARGTAYAVAAKLEPVLLPLFTRLSRWLNSQGGRNWIAGEIEGIVHAIERLDLGKLDGLLQRVEHIMAMLGLTGGGGKGAGGGSSWASWLGKGLGAAGLLALFSPGRSLLKGLFGGGVAAGRGLAAAVPWLARIPGVGPALGIAAALGAGYLATGGAVAPGRSGARGAPAGETVFGSALHWLGQKLGLTGAAPSASAPIPPKGGAAAPIPPKPAPHRSLLQRLGDALLPSAEAAPMPAPAAASHAPLGFQAPAGGFGGKAPVIAAALRRDLGIGAADAAAILGNLGFESAGFTAFHERGQPEGRGGYGWAQWTASRRRAFFAWAKEHGLDPRSDAANYGFLLEELSGPYRNLLARVMHTEGLAAKTKLFGIGFEAPGGTTADYLPGFAGRERYAELALDAVGTSAAGSGFESGLSAPAIAPPGDTSHQVEIVFKNAPFGTRAAIRRAEGPAGISLRVNYAMATP